MRAARAWSGMSVNEWADQLGYSRQQINSYETNKVPDGDVLEAAAKLIGAPIEWMRHGFNEERGVVPLAAALRASELLQATARVQRRASQEETRSE